jgi:SAM-dependent methyltransferase
MIIERVWKVVRQFAPVQLYPLLSPVHRWRRRVYLRRLDESDRSYLARFPEGLCPPAELRYNVAGPCTIEEFLASGEQAVADIEEALGSVGKSMTQVRRFLDFGCGCGRLIIALSRRWPDLEIAGCDVDERGIAWCQRHLPGSTCVVNDALPPAPFEDESFDLIWCGSVFTHLDEARQDSWLAEMRRVLTPGGILLASVHGPHCWKPRLPSWTIASLKRKGMIFARVGADAGIHPSWYQVAWHTEEYIRTHWANVFDIQGYRERGLNGYQDVVVAQKGR